MANPSVAGTIDPDLSGELRALVKRRLQNAPFLKPLAAVEARWIVDQALRYAPDGETARREAQRMATQRLAGRPLSRVFGEAEFYGLPFGLNDATLDPRNDTEALVNLVLAHVDVCDLRLLDLGTGTGCIPIALLSQRLGWHGVGVDIASDAVDQARTNMENPAFEGLNLTSRLSFQQSNWFEAFEGSDKRFEVIVSNPPYLTSADMDSLDSTVKGYDPDRALFGGEDGLDAYRHILRYSGRWLCGVSLLGLEIGWTQRNDVVDLARQSGFELLAEQRDLAGRDRALLFKYLPVG